jgi:predicted nucleic acid-binding protein
VRCASARYLRRGNGLGRAPFSGETSYAEAANLLRISVLGRFWRLADVPVFVYRLGRLVLSTWQVCHRRFPLFLEVDDAADGLVAAHQVERRVYLLPGDAHLAANAVENGGLDEVSFL